MGTCRNGDTVRADKGTGACRRRQWNFAENADGTGRGRPSNLRRTATELAENGTETNDATEFGVGSQVPFSQIGFPVHAQKRRENLPRHGHQAWRHLHSKYAQ